jgi:hypothetical protein
VQRTSEIWKFKCSGEGREEKMKEGPKVEEGPEVKGELNVKEGRKARKVKEGGTEGRETWRKEGRKEEMKEGKKEGRKVKVVRERGKIL